MLHCAPYCPKSPKYPTSMTLNILLAASALALTACDTAVPPPRASSLAAASLPALLSQETANDYRAMLPEIGDAGLASLLGSGDVVFYDKKVMPAGYQDSMGDPKGMRPNTIDPGLINLAVPGGHGWLFQRHGLFHFPFGTGGMDQASNGSSFNFWIPPRGDDGQLLPVVYWRAAFTRWHWLFPVGTRIGEVLLTTLPNGTTKVFEIRVRKRVADGWESDILRPFATAASLAAAVRAARPNWQSQPSLAKLVYHLEDDSNLAAHTLEAPQFPGTFDRLDGYRDMTPDAGDDALIATLLSETPFRSVKGQTWKKSGGAQAFGPSAAGKGGIVPQSYDGGMFEVTDTSCTRCHQDAGRQIGDFHSDLVAYGELWGEDQTFSWYPFEPSAFVSAGGAVVSFNDDNRQLRESFRTSGIVVPYEQAVHSASLYRQLPHSWTYKPF